MVLLGPPRNGFEEIQFRLHSQKLIEPLKTRTPETDPVEWGDRAQIVRSTLGTQALIALPINRPQYMRRDFPHTQKNLLCFTKKLHEDSLDKHSSGCVSTCHFLGMYFLCLRWDWGWTWLGVGTRGDKVWGAHGIPGGPAAGCFRPTAGAVVAQAV